MKFLILILGLQAASLTMAQDLVIGIINEMSGEVSVKHVDGTDVGARVGMKLSIGESVVTAAGASAKVLMKDRNVFFVGESSTLNLQEYSSDESKSGATTIRLEGSAAVKIMRKYDDQESTFRLLTETAVAGVRGTEFSVEQEGAGATKFTTYEGVVEVGEKLNGRKIESPMRVEKGFQVATRNGHLDRSGMKHLSSTELKGARESALRPHAKPAARVEKKTEKHLEKKPEKKSERKPRR